MQAAETLIDKRLYVRRQLMNGVAAVQKANESLDASRRALSLAFTAMEARCLHSMHTHFLDMQRSPPRKRPLMYPIHVCTCNPIHVCTCINASWPSKLWKKSQLAI